MNKIGDLNETRGVKSKLKNEIDSASNFFEFVDDFLKDTELSI